MIRLRSATGASARDASCAESNAAVYGSTAIASHVPCAVLGLQRRPHTRRALGFGAAVGCCGAGRPLLPVLTDSVEKGSVKVADRIDHGRLINVINPTVGRSRSWISTIKPETITAMR